MGWLVGDLRDCLQTSRVNKPISPLFSVHLQTIAKSIVPKIGHIPQLQAQIDLSVTSEHPTVSPASARRSQHPKRTLTLDDMIPQPRSRFPTPLHHLRSLTLPATMNPAASLDLFVLTFNCAKNIIDVDVFARHLQNALLQHGQTTQGDGSVQLPDLVVFSLQEISPLAQSFVGGYLLNPYLMPFKEALNLAASQLDDQQQQPQPQPATAAASRRSSSRPQPSLQRASTSTLSTLWRRQQDYPYKLVASRNVGMTAIMMFARKPDAIHHMQFAECAFGIADMGNKGAIALRVTYSGAGHQGEDQDEAAEQRTTEITFVATHLAAMEYNLRRRNANWASIVVCTSCLPVSI